MMSSTPPPLPPQAEEFLRRLRAGLAPLPGEEREDVLAEVRTHLSERHAQGRLDLARDFGTPETYAAGFLSEHALSGALAQGTSLELGRALLTGARNGLLTLFLVIPLWILQLMGGVLAALGLLKPLLPSLIGLFRDDAGKVLVLGLYTGPSAAREVLGYWAVPLFLVAGVLLAWTCNRALRALARRKLDAGRPLAR